MAPLSKSTVLSNPVLVPVGALLFAVTCTVGVCRWAFGNVADTAALRVQVQAIDARVSKAEARLDKSDERWDQIKDDLSQIKQRLGIVESKTPAAGTK